MRQSLGLKKGQAGFSLVELMVVVAIIGVLATIAIPRVNRFIAKSRQSEAQVNLSSFYTFNKNFYVEFQGYTNAFDMMGFRPEGQLRYNVGIGGTAAGPNQYVVLKGTAFAGNTETKDACPLQTAAATAALQCFTLEGATNDEPDDVAGAIAADFSTFTAQATALLIANGNVDLWSITENKNLINNSDGTQD